MLLAAILIGAWAMYHYQTRRKAAEQAAPTFTVRTAKITTGALERRIRLAGTTSAKNFASIAAPRMRGPEGDRALVLISLAKAGAHVKKGDVVAQIDAQAIKDHVDDINSQVIQAESDIKKRKAEQAIEMENLRQTLRAAKAELDKAKLDASASDIRTPIDVELLKLSVEETEANYKQLLANIPLQEASHRSEIKILEYTRERQARHRDRHLIDVQKFTMRAPIDGLVVMQSVWRSGEMGQIQEGDQVFPGQPFMKIVDPRSMQLEATVNQTDAEELRIGQQANIRLDAFPEVILNGTVESVGAMAVGGWRQNYYIRNVPVRVRIEGQDSRVIPDLSASAGILLERQENAVLAPLGAVHLENGRKIVYVKQETGFEAREVQLGSRNNLQSAVISGLKPGEEVALDKPPVLASM